MVGDIPPTGQPTYHQCPSMPFSTFSALSLLRNYNQLIIPAVSDIAPRYQQILSNHPADRPVDDYKIGSSSSESPSLSPPHSGTLGAISQTSSFVPPHPLFSYQPVNPIFARPRNDALSPVFGRSFINNISGRRQRGEKKPIPEEQKDDKYFERRRRNNQAAKKSRDARKMREDQIALRATMLEHENAILRAQILTLREEASSLRQLLMAKKTELTQSTER